MRKPELIYAFARAEDTEKLTALTREHPVGADIHTYMKLFPELPEDGRLWTGKDEAGKLAAVLYDDGSYTVRLTEKNAVVAASRKGLSLFDTPPRNARLTVMEYTGGIPYAENVRTAEGKELLGVLRLLCGTEKLPDYAERRYVAMVRAVSRTLAEYRVIEENGELLSSGGIVAKNEKYALLGNIFTSPLHREQGLASRVVRALVSSALSQGLTPVLYCERRNVRFYKKLGFVLRDMDRKKNVKVGKNN